MNQIIWITVIANNDVGAGKYAPLMLWVQNEDGESKRVQFKLTTWPHAVLAVLKLTVAMSFHQKLLSQLLLKKKKGKLTVWSGL